jgi:transposase
MGSNTDIMGVEIHILIREDPININSIIRKSLLVKGYKFGRAELIFGRVIRIPIHPRKGSRPICPACKRRGAIYDTRPPRSWRHNAGWGVRVLIEYAPRRVDCKRCGEIRTEQMPWSLGKCSLTRPLICLIARWARELSWQQVADLFEVDWRQVRAAVEASVQFGLERRDTADVTLIGIDEISRRKRHSYLTQVYEIAEGRRRLLWSGVGRAAETLKEFFDYWGPERNARIEGICCDMWDPYLAAIAEYAPQATVVFDKFHIIRQLNDAVDEVRREEARELHQAGVDLLKGSRYIWLTRTDRLTSSQQVRLQQLASQSLKTHRAWLLKEALRAFWDAQSFDEAWEAFRDWFWWATHSRLEPFRRLAWMLRRRIEHILNYFRLPINNSVVEGLNDKAKVIMRRAYGFRTAKSCQLALMHGLGQLEIPDC